MSILPTLLLSAIIVGLFLHGWVRSDRALPLSSLLISIGIFGTFLGIAYALFGFDPAVIDDSVPSLLAGMRVAFVTSVVGVFFAVLLRARAILDENPAEAVAVEPEREGEPMDAEAVRELQRRVDELVHQLNAVRRAVAGSGEGSLVGQLRLVREELSQHVVRIERRLHEDGPVAAGGAGSADWRALAKRIVSLEEALEGSAGQEGSGTQGREEP